MGQFCSQKFPKSFCYSEGNERGDEEFGSNDPLEKIMIFPVKSKNSNDIKSSNSILKINEPLKEALINETTRLERDDSQSILIKSNKNIETEPKKECESNEKEIYSKTIVSSQDKFFNINPLSLINSKQVLELLYENNRRITSIEGKIFDVEKLRMFRFTEISCIEKIIKLQRFRRKILDNDFIFFTPLAKELLKSKHSYQTFFTNKNINFFEIKEPYNINGWKALYNEERDGNLFTFQIYGTAIKRQIIDKDSVYIGEINSKNERNGYGVLIKENGTLYKGVWLNGKLNGWGRVIKGIIMTEGLYIDDQLNGIGRQTTIDNSYSYDGSFSFDLKEGFGKETLNKHDQGSSHIYEGDFVNDLKHGQGKIHFPLKDESYEGSFDEGKISGKGHYKFSNKNEYKGAFLDGKMHGKGTYKWIDGSEYVGDYINNIKEGKGRFKWKDGRVYEGPFINGKMHGKGKLRYESNIFDVEFENGVLKKSKPGKGNTC